MNLEFGSSINIKSLCATTLVQSAINCGTTCAIAPIVCASTCFIGSGAGLTGTGTTFTSNNSKCLNGQLASYYSVATHVHGNINNGGCVGAISGCLLATTTSGCVTVLPSTTYTNCVGTVTSVTAGNGMTQSGTASVDPTLNIVSHAGSAGTIGTINIGADAIGVNLGTTNITAAAGDHAHGNINNGGCVGTVSGCGLCTTTSGCVTTYTITAGGITTANNGLNVAGSNVRLGGALTGNTVLTGAYKVTMPTISASTCFAGSGAGLTGTAAALRVQGLCYTEDAANYVCAWYNGSTNYVQLVDTSGNFDGTSVDYANLSNNSNLSNVACCAANDFLFINGANRRIRWNVASSVAGYSLTMSGQTGGANSTGGIVSINGGTGGATSGAGGAVTINGGVAGATTGAGGGVTIIAGAGGSGGGAAGVVTLCGGGSSGNGGATYICGGGAGGTGGALYLVGGTGPTTGNVCIYAGTQLRLNTHTAGVCVTGTLNSSSSICATTLLQSTTCTVVGTDIVLAAGVAHCMFPTCSTATAATFCICGMGYQATSTAGNGGALTVAGGPSYAGTSGGVNMGGVLTLIGGYGCNSAGASAANGGAAYLCGGCGIESGIGGTGTGGAVIIVGGCGNTTCGNVSIYSGAQLRLNTHSAGVCVTGALTTSQYICAASYLQTASCAVIGTNIYMTTGSQRSISFATASAGAGSELTIVGNTGAATGTANGGPVSIYGGAGGATAGNGGVLNLLGGNSSNAGSGTVCGGSVVIIGGTGTQNNSGDFAYGGTVFICGGYGNEPDTGNDFGGEVCIVGGNSGGGNPVGIKMFYGDNTQKLGIINTGVCVIGNIQLATNGARNICFGATATGAGSALLIQGNTGGASSAGGSVTITAGNGGTTTAAGGGLFLNGGNSTGAAASGDVDIRGGSSSVSGTGGHVYIRGGALNSAASGSVYIMAFAENMISAIANSCVALYYDNALKLNTVTNGACITGCGFATDFVASSDCRLKTSIVPISNALSMVMELQGVCYCMCNDCENEVRVGLIAQDVQKVLPEVVSHSVPSEIDIEQGITDDKLGLKYDKITAVLIEAIKEQQIQINNLTAELYYIKSKTQ